MKHWLAVILLLGVLAPGSGWAEAAREITWDHLVPVGEPIDDPTLDLTPEQGIDLGLITSIRAKRKLGTISPVDDEAEWGLELEENLRKKGLDVDALVQRYIKMEIQIRKLNNQVVGDLDGELVRMPGYVLPLEFDGTAIDEFLLVPYVGACIHVPPPPRNQMVLVKLNQSYALKDQFEPVWVTGRMRAREVKKALTVSDGVIDVSAGYTLDGLRVVPYEE